MIDSHCHLLHIGSPGDGRGMETVKQIVEDAMQSGITHLINVCIDHSEIEALEDISKTFSNVFYTYGQHPCAPMICPIPTSGCIAIGETGLDYFRAGSLELRQQQQESFRHQLAIAIDQNKPLVIHSRHAKEDTLAILKAHPLAVGVLHCFCEDLDMAKRAIDLGYYISFSGIVTFKNSNLAEVAKNLPLDRILIETDSPYLTPEPYRGRSPNTPAYLVHTATFLSELYQMDYSEFCAITRSNTIKLFNLPIS